MVPISDEVSGRKLQVSDGEFWYLLGGAFAPDQVVPTQLFYVSNGDTNGLVYHLGTALKTGSFSAPVPNNGTTLADGTYMAITCKAVDGPASPTYGVSKAVDRAAGFYSSGNSVGEFFQVDLKTRTFTPNRYNIQGRNDVNQTQMRNWVFEVSNDASSWTVLDTHTNDTTINGLNVWGSWPVTTTGKWRYLRIRNTGVDSQGGSSNYIAMQEVEFYGVLYG